MFLSNPASSSSCFSNRHPVGLLLLRHSTTTTSTTTTTNTNLPSPPKAPHIMVDYLITNCGFSLSRATKLSSKYLSHLKSPDKPNSFLSFMRDHGFNDVQLRKIISRDPRCLCSDVDTTVAPKFKSLHEHGFSESDIVHLVHSTPTLLLRDFQSSILPMINSWESLLGSRENFVKLFKCNNFWFLHSDLNKTAIPNISLLRECGVSDERICLIPEIIFLRSPEEMRAGIDRIKSLGFDPHSGMFIWALWSYAVNRESGFDAKVELMEGFGWSNEDFVSAFRKSSTFLTVSREMLAKKMRFLVEEAGCEPSEIAYCPVLLSYSLRKRLVPRHNVMKFLKLKGLTSREYKLSYTTTMSNKVFMEKYIVPHEEKHPELYEMYIASCDSRGSL